jgi:hypothetical protein
MHRIPVALLCCGLLVGCGIDHPRRGAADTRLASPHPPQSIDSVRLRWQDSARALLREIRLRSGPVEPEGPALIAVYPFLEPGAEIHDPELASLVADFRAGLVAARRIADAAGLEYWEQYGSSISLADRRSQMLSWPSVGRDGVGYVIVVPGFPPWTLFGHRADTVLAQDVAAYLEQVRAMQAPPPRGS